MKLFNGKTIDLPEYIEDLNEASKLTSNGLLGFKSGSLPELISSKIKEQIGSRFSTMHNSIATALPSC